jgi:hypothetical protein
VTALFQHRVSATVTVLCFSICYSTEVQHLFQHSVSKICYTLLQHCVSATVTALCFSNCNSTVLQHLSLRCFSLWSSTVSTLPISPSSDLHTCTLDSFLAIFRNLQFLTGEPLTGSSPRSLRDWFMIFYSIHVDDSLAQGGSSVRFVVC